MAVQVNGVHFWLRWLTKLSILLVSSLITTFPRGRGANVQETSGTPTHANVASSVAVHCFFAQRIGEPAWNWKELESDRLF